MTPKIILLTGEAGSGKTALCQQVISALRARGSHVAGILSLPRVENGVKNGIILQDVRTREQQVLATLAKVGEGTANLSWRFDPAVLALGREILRSAAPCDVLVVDELGPLELVRGEGWVVALDVLAQCQYQAALVVVRPALISRFQLVFDRAPIETLVVTRPAQQHLFKRILQEIDP